MNSDNQSIQSGYIHNASAGALADAAAAHCLRTGCAPVFVLSQPIAADPKPVLDTIALHLYNKGLTCGTKVHTFSLLVLLSSGKAMKEILTELLQQANANDGLIFLEDTYRYEYDQARSMELMDLLAMMYQHPHVHSPLVLKAPAPFDRTIFRHCPRLHENCFHMTAQSVPRNPSEPWRYQEYRRPVQEQPRQTAQPSPEKPRPEPEVRRSQEPPRKNIFKFWNRNAPWYKADPQLLEQEVMGLENYLRSRRLVCSVAPTILPGGRLTINVRVSIQELGNSKITIVYNPDFCRENRSGVRIAMSSGDNNQLRARLSLVENTFDREIGGHLFNPRRASGNQIFGSSGAAALDAIIRAMI